MRLVAPPHTRPLGILPVKTALAPARQRADRAAAWLSGICIRIVVNWVGGQRAILAGQGRMTFVMVATKDTVSRIRSARVAFAL
jgi:hypothetical protein